MVVFGAIFLSALATLRRICGLTTAQASLLASCSISSVHSYTCCVYCWREIRQWRELTLDAPNSVQERALMHFSLAYMISDTFYYVLPFSPSDVKFIIHHGIASLYVIGALACEHGARSAVLMYFLGEITSPLLNLSTLAETLQGDLPSVREEPTDTRVADPPAADARVAGGGTPAAGPTERAAGGRRQPVARFARRTHRYLSAAFAAGFVLVRTLLGVPLTLWFLTSLLYRSPRIALAWRVTMASCVALGALGSQAWTHALVAGIREERKAAARRAKKRRRIGPPLADVGEGALRTAGTPNADTAPAAAPDTAPDAVPPLDGLIPPVAPTPDALESEDRGKGSPLPGDSDGAAAARAPAPPAFRGLSASTTTRRRPDVPSGRPPLSPDSPAPAPRAARAPSAPVPPSDEELKAAQVASREPSEQDIPVGIRAVERAVEHYLRD